MTDFLRSYGAEEAAIVARLHEHSGRLLAQYLFEARVTLCDLLQGRFLRAHAWHRLEEALDLEARGVPEQVVTERLDNAAHLEWVASISERGQVYWGGRKNRDGRRPEDM